MIKTICARTPEELDKAVNDFERSMTNENGTSRVFATQTHIYIHPGDTLYNVFTAVIFYREANK